MKKPLSPKLSIIILNHNTKDLLKQCLHSISGPHQVIVVDNNSSDGSVEMVRKDFPKVELIKRSVNDGFARGNNAAQKIAGGKYILFLNSDTEVPPQTLETMVDFMESDPKIGIATCSVKLPNGKPYYASHRGFPSPWNSLCYFTGLAKLFPKVKLFNGYTLGFIPLNTVHEIDACSGAFLMIPKKLLDDVHWLDEDFFAHGEDIDICYKVKSLGYKVMYNPSVSILHYWGASGGLKSTSRQVTNASEETKKRWENARYEAMKIFYDKHYRGQYSELFRLFVFFGINLAVRLRKGLD